MNCLVSVKKESLLLSVLIPTRTSPDSVNANDTKDVFSSATSPRNSPSNRNIWIRSFSQSATASILLLSLTAISKGLSSFPCFSPFDPKANWYWYGITSKPRGLPASVSPLIWISTLFCPTHCSVYVTVYLPSLVSFISVSSRLDYQPLFGKMSQHSDLGDGGNRAYVSSWSWSPTEVEMLILIWSSS